MASAIEMTVSRKTLSETLKTIRNRWRLKVALRGLMIIVGALFLGVLVGAWIMELQRFSPTAVSNVRIGFYLILASVIWWFGIRPLVRRVDEKQVALYLEEREPSLETSVLSVVELGAKEHSEAHQSSRLFSRIVEMAVARVQAIGGGIRVETQKMMVSLGVILVTCLIGASVLHMGPEFFRAGARLLLTPWSDVDSVTPYVIDVEPGNATVARGGDQTIRARLSGFHAQEVDLAVQRNGQGEWKRLPMSATREPDVFEIRLLDITEPTTYYIEASDVQSPQYQLEVVDRPTVQTIALEYRYPKHTGMETAWVDDGGDIAAPVGTSVFIRAKTTMPVAGGRIVFEGQESIPLTLDADGTLTGTIIVWENDFYTIELETEGGFVAGTVPYTIEAIEDRSPTIVFRKPGRDLPVGVRDEIFTQIEAIDDYGLVNIELRYSVNGGEEKRVALYSSRNRQTNIVRDYTFALNKLDLKPGDFVSYYAETVDNDSVRGKVAKTDIYFLHVRSPEEAQDQQQDESSDENEGGLNTLSKLQQDIITRTFKADRDESQLTPDEHQEQLTVIARSQSELSERVDKLVTKLQDRGIESFDSVYRTITKELAEARDEMRSATQQLGNGNLPKALEHEQRALRHLQRAETLFQKRRKEPADPTSIYFKSYEPTATNLDDMFDVDDDSEPPKDSEKRAKQDSVDQRVEDVIQQLKKITAEQQQENQRQAQRKAQSQQEASDGGRNQRTLAEKTEKVARQLQRDARDNPEDYALRNAEQELQSAIKGMQMLSIGVRGDQGGEDIVKQLNQAREILEKRQQQREKQKEQQKNKNNNQQGQQQKNQQQGQQQGSQPGQQQSQQGQQQSRRSGQDQDGRGTLERVRQMIRDTDKLFGDPGLNLPPEEYARQRESLERLRDSLKQQGVPTDALDTTIKEIQALENAQTKTDPATRELLQQSIIQGLKRWELAVRRRIATETALRPVTSGTTDIPSGFKSLVAEYYRSIAKQRRGPVK